LSFTGKKQYIGHTQCLHLRLVLREIIYFVLPVQPADVTFQGIIDEEKKFINNVGWTYELVRLYGEIVGVAVQFCLLTDHRRPLDAFVYAPVQWRVVYLVLDIIFVPHN